MSDSPKRLKELREGKNLTQEELAEVMKLTKSAISNWERGTRKPARENLEALADYFNVDLDFLRGRTDIKNASEELVKIGRYSDEDRLPINNKKRIPLIGQISAGQPILAIENIERYEMVDEENVDFALRVKGTSMIGAGILEGSIVYVQQEADIENGDIVIAMIGDEATVKRFYRYNGNVVLRPENPLLKEMVYRPEEVKVIGKVRCAKINF